MCQVVYSHVTWSRVCVSSFIVVLCGVEYVLGDL